MTHETFATSAYKQAVYMFLDLLTGTKFTSVPAVPMLLLSYVIELWCLARVYSPMMARLLPEVPYPLVQLQPSVVNASVPHQTASDAPARRSITSGGIGYHGACTSLEGMADQVRIYLEEKTDWKQEYYDPDKMVSSVVKQVEGATLTVLGNAR
jgi:hypothetical protein